MKLSKTTDTKKLNFDIFHCIKTKKKFTRQILEMDSKIFCGLFIQIYVKKYIKGIYQIKTTYKRIKQIK